MKNILYFLLLVFISCQKEKQSTNEIIPVKNNSTKNFVLKKDEKIVYEQFKADTLTAIKIKGFETMSSHKISNLKIIEGYYRPVEGKMVFPETENDFGQRFLFLNKFNEIVFKSKGQGEVFLNEPFFYKNNYNDKIVIVAQLAFEYFMGGDVFLVDEEEIKYLGNIDVSGKNMETSLIDILRIKEKNERIIFSFDSDTLLLKPGSDDQLIKNKNNRYEYDGNTFEFK